LLPLFPLGGTRLLAVDGSLVLAREQARSTKASASCRTPDHGSTIKIYIKHQEETVNL
jgi:hypothetical protein